MPKETGLTEEDTIIITMDFIDDHERLPKTANWKIRVTVYPVEKQEVQVFDIEAYKAKNEQRERDL